LAKSYESLKVQTDKVKEVLGKLTPPEPSDEFESLRTEILARFDKLDEFLVGQITGEGSLSLPAAEPE
jgi:hypothetical protein